MWPEAVPDFLGLDSSDTMVNHIVTLARDIDIAGDGLAEITADNIRTLAAAAAEQPLKFNNDLVMLNTQNTPLKMRKTRTNVCQNVT